MKPFFNILTLLKFPVLFLHNSPAAHQPTMNTTSHPTNPSTPDPRACHSLCHGSPGKEKRSGPKHGPRRKSIPQLVKNTEKILPLDPAMAQTPTVKVANVNTVVRCPPAEVDQALFDHSLPEYRIPFICALVIPMTPPKTRAQMKSMRYSGREWSKRAWSTSAGGHPTTVFTLATLTVEVCTMAGSSGRIFPVFFTNCGMLLRRGPYFGPERFSFPGCPWRRERQARGSRVDGFEGWEVVFIVGW